MRTRSSFRNYRQIRSAHGRFHFSLGDLVATTSPIHSHNLICREYCFRFPGGESYHDLVRRLNTVVIDVEQQVVPVLVVSHVSILQCLMAYFRNTPVKNCMTAEVPMHTVIKFEPARGGGWQESWHPLDSQPAKSIAPVASESEFSNLTIEQEASQTGEQPIWWGETTTSKTSPRNVRKHLSC